MAKVTIGCAIEIPNHNSAWKTDGSGQTGLADGWTSEALADTDLTFNRKSLQFGFASSGTVKAGAHIMGSGHALRVDVPTGLGTASRKLFSPQTLPGMFWGSEQMNLDGRGYFYYRLYVLLRVETSITTGLHRFGIRVWNANEDRYTDICDMTLTAGQQDGTWQVVEKTALLDSTGWVGGGSGDNPDHAKFFFNATGNVSGSTSKVWIAGAWLETLGPVDTGAGSDTLHGTLTSRYELSKDYHMRGGLRPVSYASMGKTRRLPSGSSRSFDPSGGARKRNVTLPHRLLSRTDYEKLYLLWVANKGYPMNDGSSFGTRFPLLVRTNLPDDPFPIVCDFVDETFPITTYDQAWLPAAESDQLYSGVLRLSER